MERASSHLLMSAITSPNDHSSIKPAPNVEFSDSVEESDINLEMLKVSAVMPCQRSTI